MKDFVSEIKNIIEEARSNAVRSVDFCRVKMYWCIGQRIVEEEQGGKIRAEYGSKLLQNLARVPEPEYGAGFKIRQLERARQFFLNIQLRPHCGRNSTGLSISCLCQSLTKISVNIMNLKHLIITGLDGNLNVR